METAINVHHNLRDLARDKIFNIAPYQRPYDWDAQQLIDLWNDINSIAPGKLYSMDSMKIQMKSKQTHISNQLQTLTVYDVIDGQQRITSLFILIKLVTLYLESMENKMAIKNNYIFTNLNNNTGIYRLFLQDDLNDQFQVIMNLKQTQDLSKAKINTASERRLYAAYTLYNNNINQMKTAYIKENQFQQYLQGLFRKITEQLYFSVLIVGENANTSLLFENSNYRGKQVTDIQRLKSRLLHIATLHTTDKELHNRINATWSIVYRTLMAADLGKETDEKQFLRYTWQSINEAHIKDIYRSLCQYFDETRADVVAKVQGFLNILEGSVVIYCDLYSPYRLEAFSLYQTLQNQIKDKAIELHRLSDHFNLFVPLLIAVHNTTHAGTNGTVLLKLLGYVEVYMMRMFHFSLKNANNGERDLNRFAGKIYSGKATFAQLEKFIIEKINKDAPINNIISFIRSNKDFYDWKAIKHFLIQYDLSLQTNIPNVSKYFQQNRPIEFADVSIEHVIPQQYNNGDYWITQFGTEQDCEVYMKRLGNMSLCKKNWNASYGTKSFPDKRDSQPIGYIHSEYAIERDLGKYKDWNPHTLLQREDEMIQWAVNRWSIN